MLTARRCTLLLLSALLAAALAAALAPAARAAVTCDRYASPAGDDAAAGTAAAPLRTAQKLVSGLTAGQTGCLLPGTYSEDVKVASGGAPGAPITLAAGPQGGATLVGRLWVSDSANDVVVRDLTLDGRNGGNLPSPSVNGDRVSFVANDVSNGNTTICFDIGSVIGYGVAHNVLLEGNRIHNCGILPPQNHHHGVFLENSMQRRRPRQRHLRQRRQGHPRLPRLRREPDRAQRDRRQLDRDPDRRLDARRPVASDLPQGQPRPAQRDHQLAALQRRGLLGVAAARRRQQRRHRQLPLRRRLRDPDPGAVAGVAVGRGLHDAREPGLGPGLREPFGEGVRAHRRQRLRRLRAGRRPPVACSCAARSSGRLPPLRRRPRHPRARSPPTRSRSRSRSGRATSQSAGDGRLRIAFTRRPRLVRPGRLAVRIAAAPKSRIVFVVRSRGRILGVVRTRSDARGRRPPRARDPAPERHASSASRPASAATVSSGARR